MNEFTPLTPQQYQGAVNAGFSHDNIIRMEQQRKAEFQSGKITESPFVKIGNFFANNFPGEKTGEYLGQKLGSALGLKRVSNAPAQVTGAQALGDVAQGALTIAAPFVGGGASVGGRIASNAALGAGLGGTGAVAEGKDLAGVAKSAILGGALGGGISAVTEGIGALVKNLPTWFTKSALPKIKDTTVPYALENAPLGSTKTFLEHSNAAVKSYGNQIQSILGHPQYINETGNGAASIEGVIQDFPNAKLDSSKILDAVTSVVPGSEKLVDKLANGSATLIEKDQLRQALDLATKKVFTDSPALTFNKQIAHSLADTLRKEVQSVAPETIPVFSEFSKELDLNKILTGLERKNNFKPTWQDALSIWVGYQTGGIKGAGEALIAERLLGTTGGKMAIAKGAQILGKTAPTIGGLENALKAPIIRKLTK